MNEQQVARGRRAVACPGWKWMPGVRVALGAHWGRLVFEDGVLLHVSEHDGSVAGFPAEWEGANPTPDLEDSATLGCLAALAREALGEPGAGSVAFANDWSIERYDADSDDWQALFRNGTWGTPGRYGVISEPSEPDAWLAALEAAGRR